MHPEDNFRKQLSITDTVGKRVWLYPEIIKGSLYQYRAATAALLLLLFFAGPFLRWNGKPFLLLNVVEREFVLFGFPLWPHDNILMVMGMLLLLFFIVSFTVVFGRVWCGWVCPQTIFMEWVFRKIEFIVEGNSGRRRKLDAMPRNAEKTFKKSLKHLLFLTVSFLISNTFLAYIIGSEGLFKIINEPVLQHLAGFSSLVFFTLVFYLVFSKVREMVCIMICPYGRLQGVLTDSDTFQVAYNYLRGEPRNKINRSETFENTGDCVDCKLCVNVCPTGIDIRNGNQMECINCTACIDACNMVMKKTGKSSGLIGYYSTKDIKKGLKRTMNRKAAGYLIVLLLTGAMFSFMVVTRKPVEVTVLKAAGMLYREQDNGNISNLYQISLLNKSEADFIAELRLRGIEGTIKMAGDSLKVEPMKETRGMFIIEVSPRFIHESRTSLEVEVWGDGEKLNTVKTVFLSPVSATDFKRNFKW